MGESRLGTFVGIALYAVLMFFVLFVALGFLPMAAAYAGQVVAVVALFFLVKWGPLQHKARNIAKGCLAGAVAYFILTLILSAPSFMTYVASCLIEKSCY